MTQLRNGFAAFAGAVSVAASSPLAFTFAFALVATWVLIGSRMHYSEFWQFLMSMTSGITTFLMVFILNNAQNRDTLAINSKLDAVILALEAADNRLIGLERLPASEAQAIQQEVHALRDIADEAVSERE
jgi:low affinity Fe/Cu permease